MFEAAFNFLCLDSIDSCGGWSTLGPIEHYGKRVIAAVNHRFHGVVEAIAYPTRDTEPFGFITHRFAVTNTLHNAMHDEVERHFYGRKVARTLSLRSVAMVR